MIPPRLQISVTRMPRQRFRKHQIRIWASSKIANPAQTRTPVEASTKSITSSRFELRVAVRASEEGASFCVFMP